MNNHNDQKPQNTQNELEDFEAFLEDNFNPYRFANDLLLGTNDHDAVELDIDTSIKKLTFDIDEVDKRMTNISTQNYESLVSNFSDIESTNALMKLKITPLLERANNSFEKMKTEIIDPYDEAHKMNQALKRVHTTLDLLRGSNFFFLIILQTDDLEHNLEDEDRKSKTNDLIKLAKLYKQIIELYENEKNLKDQEFKISLLSIKLIRDYQSIHNLKVHNLLETCVNTIMNEFSHNSSFTIHNVLLQNNLMAYYILNGKDFIKVLEEATMNKQVQLINNQLSRSLQSPRNFVVILKEIKQTSIEFLNKLQKILASCEVNEPNGASNLLKVYLKHGEVNELSDIYWPQLTSRFKRTIASTMARGGPIAKNLRTYYQGIRNSINETFQDEPKVLEMVLEAIDLIIHGS